MTMKHDILGWVNGASTFHTGFDTAFYVAQDQGEGIVSYGNRDWTDYQVSVASFKINLGTAGVAIRVQGLRRWYALVIKPRKAMLVKALDEQRIELDAAEFEWKLDEQYTIELTAFGDSIRGKIGNVVLEAKDDQYNGGGLGLIPIDGSLTAADIRIGPS